MTPSDRSNLTVLLICCGIMLGAGVGAAFGNVAIGLPAGMALGAFVAIFANMGGR